MLETVRFAFVTFQPFVKEKGEKGKEILYGIMPDMVERIGRWMNYTPEYVNAPGNGFGDARNGTTTGLYHLLVENKADIILNPVPPLADFMKHATYDNVVSTDELGLLCGRMVKEPGLFQFLNVLSPQVWFGMLLSLGLSAASMSSIYQISKKSSIFEWFKTTIMYVWVLYTYLIHQAPNEKWTLRNKAKSRISWVMVSQVTVWVICVAFLIMNVLKGGVFSQMALVKSIPIVNTRMDMITKSHVGIRTYPWCTRDIVFTGSGITITDSITQRLDSNWINVDHVPLFNDDHLKQTEEGKLCLIHGLVILDLVLDWRFKTKAQCNFHISNDRFYYIPGMNAVSRRLPKNFTRKFNNGMMRLLETGIPLKELKATAKGSELCQKYFVHDLQPLSIKNIYGFLYLFCGGMIISIFVLFLEILVFKLRGNSNKKK